MKDIVNHYTTALVEQASLLTLCGGNMFSLGGANESDLN